MEDKKDSSYQSLVKKSPLILAAFASFAWGWFVVRPTAWIRLVL